MTKAGRVLRMPPGPEPVRVRDERVCETLTMYVPVPPVPVPKAVIMVPDNTPVPVTNCPTARAPEVTALTVSVVPEIEPVTTPWFADRLSEEIVCDALTV